jgi:prepilin-type N-terminal cleavage/methylation domain-containing protein
MNSCMPARGRGGFSLIELLVVVGIIGILASIIFVAIDKTQDAAKRTRAKVQVKQLEKAFTSYFDEYGEWPLRGGELEDEGTEGIPLEEYIAKLLDGETADDQNDQEIRFYNIADGLIRTDPEGVTGFVDPWGRCYRYMMDFDDDGTVEILYVSPSGSNYVERIPGQAVCVWSQGQDGDGSDRKDNITSWNVR